MIYESGKLVGLGICAGERIKQGLFMWDVYSRVTM